MSLIWALGICCCPQMYLLGRYWRVYNGAFQKSSKTSLGSSPVARGQQTEILSSCADNAVRRKGSCIFSQPLEWIGRLPLIQGEEALPFLHALGKDRGKFSSWFLVLRGLWCKHVKEPFLSFRCLTLTYTISWLPLLLVVVVVVNTWFRDFPEPASNIMAFFCLFHQVAITP